MRPGLLIDLVDLCEVTRKGGNTTVLLDTGDYTRGAPMKEWIRCGAVCLHGGHDKRVPWTLGARAGKGVTDFEHDSPWIFQIPLIGPDFAFIDNGVVWVSGWIGGDPENLRVPVVSGYDPTRLPDSQLCTKCKPNHRMVPEGYFAGPPPEETLWQQLVGRRIEVVIRP